MRYEIPTRAWLSVLILTASAVLVGCGTAAKLPAFEQSFGSYELPEDSTFERERLPVEPDVELRDGVFVLTEAQFIEFEVFVERAYQLQTLLDIRETQIAAMEEERYWLVQAGRQTEQQLALVGQMYENAAQECRLVRLGAYGIAGLSFIILGAGAL